MSIIFDIRNLKNCQDYKQKRADFFRTLHLQQKLNRNYEQAMLQRMQNEKLGVVPLGESPRSLEDERKDLLLQQNLALKNLQTIMKAEEARKLLSMLSDSRVYELNTNFQAVKDILKGRTNISADFFKRVLERYLLALAFTGGTGIPIPLSEDTLSKLPADLIDKWENYARNVIDPTTGVRVNLDEIVRDTATTLNRDPVDVYQEVKMEIDMDRQLDTPLEEFVKRKREEEEAITPSKRIKVEPEPSKKRVKEEVPTLPSKKARLSPEEKGSLKRRMEEESQLLEEAIKRAKMGPAPDPLPFRRGQKRLSRTTLEAELVKRQRMMEPSYKRKGAPLEGEIKKKAKQTKYLIPMPLQTEFEEAFEAFTPEQLQQARIEAAREVRMRGERRARELMSRKPTMPTNQIVKETRASVRSALDRAKEEARQEIKRRAEARAQELGQGLFISPQRSSATDFSIIQGSGKPMVKVGQKSKIVKMKNKICGRGIEEESQCMFGKYRIHMPSLLKKSSINIQYSNRTQVRFIPQRFVSNPFTEMVLGFLKTGVLDKTLFNKLGEEEQIYFRKLARQCGIETEIGQGVYLTPEEEEDIRQFELLKGQIVAGNNDPSLLKEMKSYIFKFINNGQLNRTTGRTLLYEIACLT